MYELFGKCKIVNLLISLEYCFLIFFLKNDISWGRNYLEACLQLIVIVCVMWDKVVFVFDINTLVF